MVRLHPRLFVTAVCGAAVYALCTVASSAAVRWVIDHVIVPRFEDGSVGAGTVVAGATLVIAIGIVRAAGVVVRRTWAGKTQWRVAETLTDSVVDRLVDQPMVWHDRRPDGDLVARAGVDADGAVAVLAPIPFATSTILLLVVSGIWLLATDPIMGAVAVGVFPILIGLNVVYQRRVDRHFDDAQGHLGRLSSGVHESFEGVALVKAYGAETRETARLSEVASRLRDSRVHALRMRGTFEALLEAIPSLTNAALVVIGAYRVRDGAITVGELSSFIYLFTLLVFPLRLIGFALSELPYSMAGWSRVRAVLDEPIEPDPEAAIGVPADSLAVELDGLSFQFENDTRAVLTGIDLRVEPGSVVAIVGPTGSGKTTLLMLMAGLQPPSSGSVRMASGRPRAIVFQEAFLFSGTLRDNLALGGEFTDEQMWEALSRAAADQFVAELPHQLDTVVGERGVSLSGGQRQRVALARALLRRPGVLLLDDTTSALDPSTEAVVLGNLRQWFSDTTVVMVASRPSTIALADEVVHLVDGRITGHATHAELMSSIDSYRELVEAFEADRQVVL